MQSYPLEPGVLSTFKGLTILRLILLVLSAVAQILLTGWPATVPLLLMVLSLGDALILLLYLSSDALVVRLKSAYLPIAITVASVGPILEQHISSLATHNTAEVNFLISAWQLFPLLFIPLFVTAWQYSFRRVAWFCLGTAMVDLALSAILRQPSGTALLRPAAGVVFIRTAAYLLVGYMVVNLMGSQRRLREALTQTNNRLSQYAVTLEKLAVSQERNRLARELHDVVAHSLSGAAVELEAVKALWTKEPDRAQEMLDQSLTTVRTGLTETRRALQALRAAPLDDLGLGLAVRNLAESITSRAGIALDLQIPEKLGSFSPDIEQCVYRIAEETLTNISTHACASRVTVRLEQNGRQLCLDVVDDGKGFDPQKVDDRQSLGIRGMRERAEMVGGRFFVESRLGAGTAVHLVLEKRDGPGIDL